MTSAQNEDGVIVGTSQRQEWLLPWWWMHFRLFNNHPVTFVDFGDLSAPAAEWCRKRGDVVKLDLSDSFMAKKEEIDPQQAAVWEKMQPNVWTLRFTWYKKPFSLLKSPYRRTVWLDLDCQVRGSIQPMFELCENEGGFAAAPEHQPSQNLNMQRGMIAPGQTMYNAGVLVFHQNSKIVQEWADRSIDQNRRHCSDQQLMAVVLNARKYAFTSLSPFYNWTADRGCTPDVVILHWWGDAGKQAIIAMIERMTTLLNFNLSFDDLSGRKLSSPLITF